MSNSYINPSKRLDWLTPIDLYETVEKPLFGEIDFDPCGNESQVIPVNDMTTGQGTPGDDDDGMFAAWHKKGEGRVHFNPTYGERKPEAKPGDPPLPPMPCFYPLSRWIRKAQSERGYGAHVFCVLPAGTGKVWFHQYMANPLGLPGMGAIFTLLESRIKFRLFDMPPEQKSQPGMDHMLALLSPDPKLRQLYGDLTDHLGMVVDATLD